ncbi:hypothetical protein POM88_054860 [Heracleum sosnowskyi]|uniref:Increased DNA methylation 1 C-terminal domain-containing protein n=1 Tax=Heracleum sosnowskyi TaxID=360622 RepID=A0AAD8GLY3_9APIA|nr:hypothetical protein POM88_054860 [Heracleum sosnowskyi]
MHAQLSLCLSSIFRARTIKYRFKFFVQGYLQALFSCIEQLLVSINIKRNRRTVLPATEVADYTWTNKLGFKKISDGRFRVYKGLPVDHNVFGDIVLSEANCNSKVVQRTSQLDGSSRTSVMEEV